MWNLISAMIATLSVVSAHRMLPYGSKKVGIPGHLGLGALQFLVAALCASRIPLVAALWALTGALNVLIAFNRLRRAAAEKAHATPDEV